MTVITETLGYSTEMREKLKAIADSLIAIDDGAPYHQRLRELEQECRDLLLTVYEEIGEDFSD